MRRRRPDGSGSSCWTPRRGRRRGCSPATLWRRSGVILRRQPRKGRERSGPQRADCRRSRPRRIRGGSGSLGELGEDRHRRVPARFLSESPLAACSGRGGGKVAEALPFLRYKAQSDPEQSVRGEACRSLRDSGRGRGRTGRPGTDSPFAFLRARLEDKSGEGRAQGALLRSPLALRPAGSMPALEAGSRRRPPRRTGASIPRSRERWRTPTRRPASARSPAYLLSDKEYLIRMAGIEWIRKNKAPDLVRGPRAAGARSDPSEMISKRAAEALKAFR